MKQPTNPKHFQTKIRIDSTAKVQHNSKIKSTILKQITNVNLNMRKEKRREEKEVFN